MKDKAAEFITPEEQAKHKRAVGADGETAACELLGKKGYEIAARNYRAGRGEIYIIARSSRHIVFVEVKTRTAGTLIQGAAAVDRGKRRSIIACARQYLDTHQLDLYPRFDVIEVYTQDGSVIEINHIENAFDGRGRPTV